MYEIFEHTADVGLRMRADDFEGLLVDAARGLFSLLVANPESIRAVQELHLEVAGDRKDDLLRDWLAELLYTFSVRRLLFAEFTVQLHEGGLTATVRGEPLDRQRHVVEMEVKAITYHGLKVEQQGNQWLAEVIVDI